MELDRDRLEQALQTLGDLLQSRGLSYELAVIGGSALMLIDLSIRPTRDLDVLAVVEGKSYRRADPLPVPLNHAIEDVARNLRLPSTWVNPGPTSLLDLGLPRGFKERTETRTFGSLALHVAARKDQICFKLYAGVDQGPASKHVEDLRRLEPTEEELLEAARWAISHDPSSGFRDSLVRALAYLGVDDVGDRL